MPNTIHHNPGTLNQLVTIISPTMTQDKYGSDTSTWQPLYQVWAKVDIGNETIMPLANQVFRKIDYKITIRYLEGINENMRVVFESRTLIITKAIDLNTEHAYIELRCTEEHTTGVHSV